MTQRKQTANQVGSYFLKGTDCIIVNYSFRIDRNYLAITTTSTTTTFGNKLHNLYI